MNIGCATSGEGRAIREALEFETSLFSGSVISYPREEARLMRTARRGILTALTVMACAYLFSDWLGEWAFVLGIIGDICIATSVIRGLRYS